MRTPRLAVILALLGGTTLTPLHATVLFWTGTGPDRGIFTASNWQGGVAPPNDGTAALNFGPALFTNIALPGATSVNSLTFSRNNDWLISAAAPATLTIANGVNATIDSSNQYFIRFDPNVTLNLSQAQSWSVSQGNVLFLKGQVTGIGALTLNLQQDNINGGGFVSFNNQVANNNFTGGVTLNAIDSVTPSQQGSGAGVAIWNSQPFGTGTVTITNGALFSVRNTITLANNFTLNAPSTSPWNLRNWDAPLTLSGSVTLTGNSVIRGNFSFTSIHTPNNEFSSVLPGPLTRYPTLFTGNIGESPAGLGVTIAGPGIIIFNPTTGNNAYTGGTTVTGSLVFGNAGAIPATGTIQVGTATTGNIPGYAGTAVTTTGNFATFLSRLSSTSSGSVGVDALPGTGTATLLDPINLTGFITTATNGIRLGTATSAVQNGGITPQGNNYHFGNGGGSLIVQSALGQTALATSNSAITQLVTDNAGQFPLKLYLRGSNTYAGGTVANNGFIIFDGPSSIPGTGSLTAGGTSLNPGDSYIGYTDNVTGLTPAAFLAKFNQTGTFGIVGFDSSNTASPVSIANLNLTGFNNGVFIGTSSAAILTGSLTPSSVVNADNPANTLRFTAGNSRGLSNPNGSTLTVNSDLTDLAGPTPLSVVIGSPSFTTDYSNGTVVLAPTTANTYSGGTTLNPSGGITLAVGGAASSVTNALGAVTGALNIAPSAGIPSNIVGLQAQAAGIIIPNPIVFLTPDFTTTNPTTLALVGSNDFTLGGAISSAAVIPANSVTPGSGQSPAGIFLYNATPINVTLSGNNSNYHGDLEVVNGTLFLDSNHAAGTGTLRIDSTNATVAFTTNTATPILYGIKGDSGSLVLPNGTALTFDLTNANLNNNGHEFSGVISGAAGAPTTASLTVTASSNTNSEALFLFGVNNYSGGTSITGNGVLGLGNALSAGTGAVTINTPSFLKSTPGGMQNHPGGALFLAPGVTFTNPLNYTAGGLAGFGTFAPSNLTNVTFGTGKFVIPGIPTDKTGSTSPHEPSAGTLTFTTNVTFANGGTYYWSLDDAGRANGASLLSTTGNLIFDPALTAGGFTLQLHSHDINGNEGGFAPNFNAGNPYTWTIATAGLTIQTFNAANVAIDIANFQVGQGLSSSQFGLVLDLTSKNLLLNFTPVPEPATCALLALGLGVVLLPLRRRRR